MGSEQYYYEADKCMIQCTYTIIKPTLCKVQTGVHELRNSNHPGNHQCMIVYGFGNPYGLGIPNK